MNWLYTASRCGSLFQKALCCAALVTGNQRPSEPSTYGVRLASSSMNATNFLAPSLFLAVLKITPVLTAARYTILEPSGLFGKAAWAISSVYFFLAVARSASVAPAFFMLSSHCAGMEIVALWVITVVLLWKATLLSGFFQLVDEGGVHPFL